MLSLLRSALVLFAVLTALTGVLYPLLVTTIAQTLFPQKAAGSVIVRDGQAVGSRLIGQSFTDPKYFWGRPSATALMPNNASASGGSNLGSLNPALQEAVKARIKALRSADPGNLASVPVDLVTASGSGLDPDISIAAALYQAARVARLRTLAPAQVEAPIARDSQDRWLGFVGEPRVNVLQLNLALDALRP